MSDFGSARLENELDALADEHPHLREHLEWFHEEYGEYPKLIDEPSEEWESDRPNVIYEAEAPIFCHVYGDMGIDTTYYCVEPTLEDEDKALYDRIRQRILDKSVTRPAPGDNEEFEEHLDELLDEVVEITSGITGQSIGRLKSFGTSKVSLSQDQFTRLRYQLQRDIVGLGPLEPVMADTANEDIHVIGPKQCYLDHGTYGMISATVDFGTPEEFEQWLRKHGRADEPPDQRFRSDHRRDAARRLAYQHHLLRRRLRPGALDDHPTGRGDPAVGLPDNEVGTISPNWPRTSGSVSRTNRPCSSSAKTASGKTTTLNAALSFIPRDAKIYTAEDTSEVIPPHNTWQQLLTREDRATSRPTWTCSTWSQQRPIAAGLHHRG